MSKPLCVAVVDRFFNHILWWYGDGEKLTEMHKHGDNMGSNARLAKWNYSEVFEV